MTHITRKRPCGGAHLLFVIAIAGTAPVEAQWRVGLGLGWEITHGFGHGVGPEKDASFVPYRPLTWAARVETPGARLRAALDLRYTTPDIALTGPDLTVVAHEDLTTVVGARPAAVLDLARLSEHLLVRVEVGPLLEIWAFDGEDARSRVSAEAALGLAVDLGGRMGALVSWTGAVTPSSPFTGFLPEDYEPRAGWRWGLRAVVMYRLD